MVRPCCAQNGPDHEHSILTVPLPRRRLRRHRKTGTGTRYAHHRRHPLIGYGCVLDSVRLVELCLEDLAGEHGFEFDRTSEAAMSRSRSIFRNAGALADEFVRQSQGAA